MLRVKRNAGPAAWPALGRQQRQQLAQRPDDRGHHRKEGRPLQAGELGGALVAVREEAHQQQQQRRVGVVEELARRGGCAGRRSGAGPGAR